MDSCDCCDVENCCNVEDNCCDMQACGDVEDCNEVDCCDVDGGGDAEDSCNAETDSLEGPISRLTVICSSSVSSNASVKSTIPIATEASSDETESDDDLLRVFCKDCGEEGQGLEDCLGVVELNARLDSESDLLEQEDLDDSFP